ncbi:DUF4258 domain-containing protein [Polyangium sp. 6x1]|uniref:DUF4258 domain-containing protein n=1 Tax=Polyangium sp. 6x1 TaxID=3042689 RepID=UPI0024832D17|nr:DUF4258 domain-containing protein [Polyangium sp. 6x1]MDI1449547.1 DUF4258 domain-containing protein [Polyangium sp. 6x1]
MADPDNKDRSLVVRLHAAKRMLQRGIRMADVEHVIANGEVIEDYPDDTPFPSRLLLAFPEGRAVHVVAADEPGALVTYIITVYLPDPTQWDPAFRRRKP